MKKALLIIALAVFMLNSCNSFEENHEIKQAVRDYLRERLHNPKNLEDVNWLIFRKHFYKNTEKGIDLDFKRIEEFEKETGKVSNIAFEYKAENTYGALRKHTLYCFYFHESKNIVVQKEMKRSILMDYFFFMNPAEIKSIRHGVELFFEKYPELKE